MKPYGIDNKKRKNYTDCHPKKLGLSNWWEVELGSIEKGRERMKIKKEIKDSDNTSHNNGSVQGEAPSTRS